jgi:4-amino-4-deoxy-L-arabinose transferase-like glycosyltransferase
LLVAATALSRFAFRSRYLYDIDSVNFALAIGRFDPRVHQPHPPGYFLYVMAGRFVNAIVHDPNAALVAISIAASCGAVALIMRLAAEWFGPAAARFAGLLFLFSPLAWFHGIVALTYIVEMFFSALVGYLCWKRRAGASAVALGIAAGFRPSTLLFLGPVYLFLLLEKARGRRVVSLASLALLAVTLAAWMIPMVSASGGFHVWWSSLAALWTSVPGKESVVNSPIANSFARLVTICGIYGLCFGCAALLPFAASPSVPACVRTFMWVWVLPGLLFFTLVFLKFVNSGYLLVLSPPVFAWLGMLASRVWKPRRGALCLAVNVAVFLFAPFYCSYASVKKLERELPSAVESARATASPEDTLIVGFDSHFMGYRHAGYYLPEYTVVEYPRMRMADGRLIFTMSRRDTQAVSEIDRARFRRFILFPLPDDASSKAYFAGIEARVGRAGPISALDALFAAGER